MTLSNPVARRLHDGSIAVSYTVRGTIEEHHCRIEITVPPTDPDYAFWDAQITLRETLTTGRKTLGDSAGLVDP
ncbi:hypothetical protein NWFMUON74_68810 [Nocardia wallacei]|uniref:Uncharacterized protein n=1 Tax=Nocardia wallacei TaxID=480035 RepID=A0A7G1KYM3_9NOCA|nr:hypothetical protein NWFMUON74_68810 [Nocardia wallacei]